MVTGRCAKVGLFCIIHVFLCLKILKQVYVKISDFRTEDSNDSAPIIHPHHCYCQNSRTPCLFQIYTAILCSIRKKESTKVCVITNVIGCTWSGSSPIQTRYFSLWITAHSSTLRIKNYNSLLSICPFLLIEHSFSTQEFKLFFYDLFYSSLPKLNENKCWRIWTWCTRQIPHNTTKNIYIKRLKWKHQTETQTTCQMFTDHGFGVDFYFEAT